MSDPIQPTPAAMDQASSTDSRPITNVTSASVRASIRLPLGVKGNSNTSENTQDQDVPSPSHPTDEDQYGRFPPGRDCRADRSGRTYYVNHNTHSTTWSRPPPSSTHSISMPIFAGPLPAGWEQRFTPHNTTYFIDRNTQISTWFDPRRVPKHSMQLESISERGPLPLGWEIRFTSYDRAIFVDHSTRRATWQDPRVSNALNQDVPLHNSSRYFERNLIYLRSQCRRIPGECQIKIRTNHIFEDSYVKIMRHQPDDLKKCLKISLHEGEAGNLSRFFCLLFKGLFAPHHHLFKSSEAKIDIMQIDPQSHINAEHLAYFKFIGRVFALAIFHACLLDVKLDPSFYKMILTKKATFADLEAVDLEMFQALTWMLENDITGVSKRSFSILDDIKSNKIIDLKENGRNLPVTDQNKEEYVELLTRWRVETLIEDQSKAFLNGFNEIIPRDLIVGFDVDQLQKLVTQMAHSQPPHCTLQTLKRKRQTE